MASLDSLLAPGRLSTLQLELEQAPGGSALWITLNRPAAFNAVSMELLKELHEVLDALQHPNDFFSEAASRLPRVVVLRGAGRAFCAGVDIKAADQGVGGKAWDYHNMRSQQQLARAIAKLRSIPQPVIAALHGAVSGAGCALALAADVRVAAKGTRMNTSFVKLGLTGCDMGTSFFLPANLPLGVAAEMMLTGRMMAAERAHALGLVNELVDDADALQAAARSMAQDMLSCSPLGLHLTKQQLNAAADGVSLQAALTAENSHQIYLVNQPQAAQIAQTWLKAMMGGSRKQQQLQQQERRQQEGRPRSKL